MTTQHAPVSVTWKWLAVTTIAALIGIAGYDRASIDRQIEELRSEFRVAPTRDDVRDLRASIDKLADRIENVRDRVIGNK